MRKRLNLKNTTTNDSVDNQPANDYQGQSPDDDLNLFDLGTTLVRKRRFIIYPVLGIMLFAAAILLLTPNRYTSTVTILPSGKTDKLSDLKSLAGMGSIVKVDESSSELFPEILRSRAVKDAVLANTYSYFDSDENKETTLQEYFGENDRELLYRSLDQVTDFGIDKKTGVIHLAVETEHPGLSQSVLSTYVDELENFNLHKRRSQAKENANYLAKQLESKKRDLAEAESRLEQFQMENRNWSSTNNPEIVNTLTHLQRELEIKSGAYLYLTQEYEMARFQAQKDVPIISLLDSPSLPTQKSGPFRTMILALVSITALFTTIFVVLIAEAVGKKSRALNNDAYRELRSNFTDAFPRTTQTINRLKRVEKELV